MVLDLTNSAVDRVRTRCADFEDVPILTDDVYQYYITKNNNNEDAATKECAFVILGWLARNSTYSKINVLIEDGKNAYLHYKDYLLAITKDLSMSNMVINPYAGGVSKSDMQANNDNPDNNVRPSFDATPQNWL